MRTNGRRFTFRVVAESSPMRRGLKVWIVGSI